ncbi:phosphatase PAP2 family protein [Paenibacillus sp. OSY-SE]|uniref:phosphatase PAP2 family protein n=1 Tax=Paenibacillus sp. OSY-SE TaxID=1196323 RepID=UPI00036EB04C|nr:phosphatase PAP2 family protein [Paenibacillus sp. OSY-SE]
MRYKQRKPRSNHYTMFFGFLLLLGFGALAIAINRQPLNPFDLNIAAFVQSFESPSLTKVMELFTSIGSTKYAIIIAVLTLVFLYFVLGHRMELIFLIAVLGGSAVMNQLLKMVIHRERPIVHRLIEETGYSFPSGHAMGAIGLYGALAFLLWRHIASRPGRILLIVSSCVMIAMIGVSRVYLGVHYPSDIIGGLMASGFWLALMIWVFQWYMEQRHTRLSSYDN